MMMNYPIGRPVNILLVDDDDVDAKAVERRFRKERITNPIFRAKDGMEALGMLRGTAGSRNISSPYLIISDINMPRMDGIEFIENVRKDPNHQGAIIFVLTTSRSEEDKFASYKLNVAGYMVKDNAGEDFLKLVNMIDSYWKVVELP
ncbi:MAG: response regulator [Alphaproteobacteria bacterium]|nr:response regulator [Alphaproteobacteria bacterium]